MASNTGDTVMDNIQNRIQQMVADRLLLAKMEFTEKAAILSGKFIVVALLALISFFVLLFISLMGAYYFARVFDSFFIGFAIIAGFYVLALLLLIWKGIKPISRLIESTIVSTIFEKEQEDSNS